MKPEIIVLGPVNNVRELGWRILYKSVITSKDTDVVLHIRPLQKCREKDKASDSLSEDIIQVSKLFK